MNKERNFWLWIILIVASLGLIYLFRKILLFVVLAAVVGFIGDPIVDQWEIGRASCRERVYVLV